MTNTEKLIADLECCKKNGVHHVDFMVGRYTGNGPAVVAALRRRGYAVSKIPAGRAAMYRLESKQ